jgi:CelD/BcsL family acetyltransferase involved in cellulose biosynthesis
MYRETMLRRNSRREYLIDEAWVQTFRQALGPRAHLFVTRWQGAVAAALLAIEHGPFLHAHLTGINAEMTAHSPFKVMLDDVREWGTLRGLQHFHLGGGVGGREDSLFQFKRRFSPVSHAFHTGRWILDPIRYAELERDHLETLQGALIEDSDYFPSYRYRPAGVPVQG